MLFIFAFLFAFIFTVVATPISVFFAKKYDVLDYPRARKVHRQPIPRWGGIAIFSGFMLSMLLVYLFFPSFKELLSFKTGLALSKQFAGVLIGGTIIFVLGLFDDKKPVHSPLKLAIQIIVAYIVMDYGVRISGIANPFKGQYLEFPIFFGQIITVFWIIGFMNTINLADGLDGLAAGIVAIAAATFFIVAILQGQTKIILLSKQLNLASIFAIALFGSCLGFLLFNFNPARVFMGDSGSLFLGFMLSVISTVGTLKTAAFISLFIPVTVVALPILDVALSIFRRMRKGMGLMDPDKEHIHHRLLSFGWTHREVVLLMYIFTLMLSICSILLTVYKGKA
jgi:UDP-GlcNAc:undecaprenyl-phosphate GlcNAc-1-phosphate transferase